MAAFARPLGPSLPSTSTPPSGSRRAASISNSASHRQLPSGQCNYRDIALGTQAPTCGCKRFWQNGSRTTGPHDEPRREDASYICVCAHHACFHDITERSTVVPGSRSPVPLAGGERAPVYVQLATAAGDGKFQLTAGSHPVTMQGLDSGKRLGLVITTPKGLGHQLQQDQPSSVVARFEQQAEQGAGRVFEQLSSSPLAHEGTPDGTVNTSGLSKAAIEQGHQTIKTLPLDALNGSQLDVGASNFNMRPPSLPAGLGLMLQGKTRALFEESPTPTVPDDPLETEKLMRLSRQEMDLHISAPKTDNLVPVFPPDRPLLQGGPDLGTATSRQALNSPAQLPYQAAFDNWLRDVPSPPHESGKGTPDLTEIRRYLEETRSFVDALSQATSAPRSGLRNVHSPSHGANSGGEATKPGEERLPVERGDVSAGLQSSLQRLVPSLNGLLDHIRVYPNISTSLHQLSSRVEQLQNASFDHVAPEDFQNKFDHVEARVLEIEGRLEQADKRWQLQNRKLGTDDASFDSKHSTRSTTSSARVQTAMDKLDMDERLKDVASRLEVLETSAPPCFAKPWEVEVCLLPFGRQLKGIWMSADEDTQAVPLHGQTQNSDEWTQARSRKSVSVDPVSSFGSNAGWSDEAIFEWAEATDEWLTPRACGPSGIIYKRLQSRGFVRKVTISSSGARHIQAAVGSAFESILRRLDDARFNSDDQISVASSNDKVSVKTFLGLRESLIPLRKVRKTSRLKFLAPSELLTPALWNVQFLDTSVIMHAPGGVRRLFVTSRAAYLQCHQEAESGWTWQKIRNLPPTLPISHNEQDAQEADSPAMDAKEAFWSHHPALDSLPPSLKSSFTSEDAVDNVSEVVNTTRNSNTRLAGSKPEKPASDPMDVSRTPITPKSLHRGGDPRISHHRTMSNPHSSSAPVAAIGNKSYGTELPQRRVASFDQPSSRSRQRHNPRRHTFDPRAARAGRNSPRSPTHRLSESPPKAHRVKRRRIEQSADSDSASLDGEEPLDVLLRVARRGLRTRQSSSEPLEVLLDVAEGNDGLTDIERRLQYSSAEREYRYRREREIQFGMRATTSDDDEVDITSAEVSDNEGNGQQKQRQNEDEHVAGHNIGQHQRADLGLQRSKTRSLRLSQTSHPAFLANPTPRLSREPTSPFKSSVDGGFTRSSSVARPLSRGAVAGPVHMEVYAAGLADGVSMPYATPYSAAGGVWSCAGDTQADTTSLLGRDQQYEEQGGDEVEYEEEVAWEGVEAGHGRGDVDTEAYPDEDMHEADDFDDEDDSDYGCESGSGQQGEDSDDSISDDQDDV